MAEAQTTGSEDLISVIDEIPAGDYVEHYKGARFRTIKEKNFDGLGHDQISAQVIRPDGSAEQVWALIDSANPSAIRAGISQRLPANGEEKEPMINVARAEGNKVASILSRGEITDPQRARDIKRDVAQKLGKISRRVNVLESRRKVPKAKTTSQGLAETPRSH